MVFKRAEQYVNEYQKKEREEIRLRRAAKNSGEFYVPAQPKVYFVIRLKGWVVGRCLSFLHPLLRCSPCALLSS